MTFFSHSLVGLIEIEPHEFIFGISDNSRDDATLESWFEKCATSKIPVAEGGLCRPSAAYPVLWASRRFSREIDSGGSDIVRADLGRLVEDLQIEYERLIAS